MAKHDLIKKSTLWLALLLTTSTSAQTLPEGTMPTLPPFPEIPAKQPFGSVKLLGSKAKLKWKQTGECLTIECPAELPCQTSIVFKID